MPSGIDELSRFLTILVLICIPTLRTRVKLVPGRVCSSPFVSIYFLSLFSDLLIVFPFFVKVEFKSRFIRPK